MEGEAAPANLLPKAIGGDPQRQRRRHADVPQIINGAEESQFRQRAVAQRIDNDRHKSQCQWNAQPNQPPAPADIRADNAPQQVSQAGPPADHGSHDESGDRRAKRADVMQTLRHAERALAIRNQ